MNDITNFFATNPIVLVVIVLGGSMLLVAFMKKASEPSPRYKAWRQYELWREQLIDYTKEVTLLGSIDAATDHDRRHLRWIEKQRDLAYEAWQSLCDDESTDVVQPESSNTKPLGG